MEDRKFVSRTYIFNFKSYILHFYVIHFTLSSHIHCAVFKGTTLHYNGSVEELNFENPAAIVDIPKVLKQLNLDCKLLFQSMHGLEEGASGIQILHHVPGLCCNTMD